MKRILAVILTIVMLLGVVMINTSADTANVYNTPPKATLVTNEGSPLDIHYNNDGDDKAIAQNGDEFYFTLRFDHFTPIKGIDVTVTVSVDEESFPKDANGNKLTDSDDNTIPIIKSIQTFSLPTAVEGVEIENIHENHERKGTYTNIVRFVDLNITRHSRIVFAVNSPSDTVEVTAVGKYADSGETLFKVTTTPKNYEIMQPTVIENCKSSDLDQDQINKTGYFVPYGGVFTGGVGNYKLFEKNTANGNFTDVSGAKYVQFKLPTTSVDNLGKQMNNLTAFGVSEHKENSDIRLFGNYSELDDYSETLYENDKNTKNTKNKHGTIVFEGDWLALKEYYIKQGNSVQQFVRAIYQDLTALEKELENDNNDSTYPNKPDDLDNSYHHIKYTITDSEGKVHYIYAYKFPREKYLWRDNVNGEGKLEYGIRLHNVRSNETYTSVAYCEVPNDEGNPTVHISHNVKSFTTPAAAN